MVPYVCGYFRSLYVYKTPEIDVTRYDPSIRKVCCCLTLTYVCVFVIAVDGLEAVKAVSEKAFDAILMDIQMPNMDGYEATRKIREIKGRQSLPIIAMTASAVMQDEKKCIEAGMNGFVPKPVRQEKLFYTLLKFIRPEFESELSSMECDILYK